MNLKKVLGKTQPGVRKGGSLITRFGHSVLRCLFQVKGEGLQCFRLEKTDVVNTSQSDHILRSKFMIFKLIKYQIVIQE